MREMDVCIHSISDRIKGQLKMSSYEFEDSSAQLYIFFLLYLSTRGQVKSRWKIAFTWVGFCQV